MRVQPTFNLWLTPDDAANERPAKRSNREVPTACTCSAKPATREPVSDVEANFAATGRQGAATFQVDPMLDWLKP